MAMRIAFGSLDFDVTQIGENVHSQLVMNGCTDIQNEEIHDRLQQAALNDLTYYIEGDEYECNTCGGRARSVKHLISYEHITECLNTVRGEYEEVKFYNPKTRWFSKPRYNSRSKAYEGVDTIVTTIQQPDDESSEEPHVHEEVSHAKPMRVKRRAVVKDHKLPTGVDAVLEKVLEQVLETGLPCEYITKRPTRIKRFSINGVKTLGVVTHHEMNDKPMGFDVPMHEENLSVYAHIMRLHNKIYRSSCNATLTLDHISQGCSGALIPRKWFKKQSDAEPSSFPFVIVRGFDRMHKRIACSTQWQSGLQIANIQHYALTDDEDLTWAEMTMAQSGQSSVEPELVRRIPRGSVEEYWFINQYPATSLAHYNIILNMLTTNTGAYEWGSRGAQVREFLERFAVVIQKDSIDATYKMRKHANTSRQTACDATRISMNTQIMRNRRGGPTIPYVSGIQSCAATNGRSYLNTGACLTNEFGQPDCSSFIEPYPGHLKVRVGTAQINIPVPYTKPSVHVFKEGFCYLEIFLYLYAAIESTNVTAFHNMIMNKIVDVLGSWPTMSDFATWASSLMTVFPELTQAPVPEILVDHQTQSLHVIDSLGSATNGYHMLNIRTFNDFKPLALNSCKSHILQYPLGGNLKANIKRTIRIVKNEKELLKELNDNPLFIFYALASPTLLQVLNRSKVLDTCIRVVMEMDDNYVRMIILLNYLAEKVSRASTLENAVQAWLNGVGPIHEALREHLDGVRDTATFTYLTSSELQQERLLCDATMHSNGHRSEEYTYFIKNEELLIASFEQLVVEQESCAEFIRGKFIGRQLIGFSKPGPSSQDEEVEDKPISSDTYFSGIVNNMKKQYKRVRAKVHSLTRKVQDYTSLAIFWIAVTGCRKFIRSKFSWVNALNALSCICVVLNLYNVLTAFKRERRRRVILETNLKYNLLQAQYDRHYLEYLNTKGIITGDKIDESLIKEFDDKFPEYQKQFGYILEERLYYQDKQVQAQMCKYFAMATMLMMVYDASKADMMYKSFSQIKSLVAAIYSGDGKGLTYQSGDVDQTAVMSVIVTEPKLPNMGTLAVTFNNWFATCIKDGRTLQEIPAARVIDFRRETAHDVVAQIIDSPESELIIRGFVGSGKSTMLPYLLSKYGKVLICEPVRVLAQNVHKQLQSSTFMLSPTLLMRGDVRYGTGKVTVATAGYAANYYASNTTMLREFDYILLDEAHQVTSDTLLLRAVAKDRGFSGKILHVSATPLGNEIPFETMYPVEVCNVGKVSHDDFCKAQGSSSKLDVSAKGSNILVYVASFSEVDKVANSLRSQGRKVAKLDSRTLMSSDGIACTGTTEEPLYLVATNIVENGVTLDVDVVVDFGMSVQPEMNSASREVKYLKKPITTGQRIQRNGRVGRFKKGYVLNIGECYKSTAEVSDIITTEAALKCFAHNVSPPLMNVDTTLIGASTREQVKIAAMFELQILMTLFLVDADGKINTAVFDVIKRFLLRDCAITLTHHAHTLGRSAGWKSLDTYVRDNDTNNKYRHLYIPFYVGDFGEQNYVKLGEAVKRAQTDARPLQLEICGDPIQTAIVLQTDPESLQRSLQKVDSELIVEKKKLEELNHMTSSSASFLARAASYTLFKARGRWQREKIIANIEIYEQARHRLIALAQTKPVSSDADYVRFVEENPDIATLLTFQNKTSYEIASALGVKGKYDYSRVTTDVFGIVVLCAIILYSMFGVLKDDIQQTLGFEGKRNRLYMRDQKEHRLGYVIDGRDDDLAQEYGESYRKHPGERKGRKGRDRDFEPATKGLGKKLRPFSTFYGFDPEEYQYCELYDPNTGAKVTVPATGQSMRNNVRDLEREMPMAETWGDTQLGDTLQATFVKKDDRDHVLHKLKVDLTKHEPTMLTSTGGIMGYPEHRGDYRQTGLPKQVLGFEGVSKVDGGPNIQPYISSMITIFSRMGGDECKVINGIHVGRRVLTNAHHMQNAYTSHDLYTARGVFTMQHTSAIRINTTPGYDAITITMPVDMPPGKMLRAFRSPQAHELVRMLKVNRTKGGVTFTLSDKCHIKPYQGTLWRHEITTVAGDCGSPLVAVKDNYIVGIHGGVVDGMGFNFFTPLEEPVVDMLLRDGGLEKTHEWVFDSSMIDRGSMTLTKKRVDSPFPVAQLLKCVDEFDFQNRRCWVASQVPENIQPVAQLDTYFNTRHIYKGLHEWFSAYLDTNDDARSYFEPYLNHYAPSILTGEAFKKDFFKYGDPTPVGLVQDSVLASATNRVIRHFEKAGFVKHSFKFITDGREVLEDLNLNASMGAQYKGKKRDYLDTITGDKFQDEFEAACYRLANGFEGVWKGSLKAELRHVDKISQGKTRVFTAAPYDVLIAAKSCVHHFNKKIYATNTKGPWTVGINKLNKGWHNMLQSLPDGWVYGTGDGSRFDSSLTPLLLNEVCSIRKQFMEELPIGHKMLDMLYRQIVWTLISAPDGTVLRKNKGNPSGQPSTVDDNTIMVMIAVEYALVNMGQGENSEDFFKYYCNGDDIIFAVRPDKEWIMREFQHSFSHLGLNYIFEKRTKNKEELEYMSLRGILREGIFIPKLSKERIVSIIQWRRNGTVGAAFDALNAAIIESWGYDDLTYQLRKYFLWLLENYYDRGLEAGKVITYHSDFAIQQLYTNEKGDGATTTAYNGLHNHAEVGVLSTLTFQAGDEKSESGSSKTATKEERTEPTPDQVRALQEAEIQRQQREREKSPLVGSHPLDIDQRRVGDNPETTEGQQERDDKELSDIFSLPPTPKGGGKIHMPKFKGRDVLEVTHYTTYKPRVGVLSNSRATQAELEAWHQEIADYFETEDISQIMTGFMVWCIENGTSPNVLGKGTWTMSSGDGEERSYSTEPFRTQSVTLRSLMRHYSEAARSYISNRRLTEPRYTTKMAQKRGLRQSQYLQYTFDFLDETCLSADENEVVHQMKAAALQGSNNRVLNLDGNLANGINTERRTAADIDQTKHTLGKISI